ncbi:MAG: 4Fe-4S binding protein [Bacteroides sp.]|nr:4Fe-4S binding protein [Bacteroides sp.]MCM1084942.1 4Fe-4S binding protein [Bacteroides sp.]
MNSLIKYFSDFFSAIKSLLTGMKTTLKVFLRKKTTELYPEKRGSLYVSPQFRGRLEMVHTEDNHHRCVACGICQMNCPNGTIRVESQTVTNAEGKSEKVLSAYHYDLGKCLFCELCVRTCPHQAIRFTNKFENAVFTRNKLQLVLNRPGSSLLPKPAKAADTNTNPAKPE